MNPVVVLQQVAHERLGTLAVAFENAGLPWHEVELYAQPQAAIDLDRAAGLVVLGGPMNVDQIGQYPFLQREVGYIEQALAEGLPVLGICLGAQLLAKTLGAKVYPNRTKEIGWYEIELTAAAGDDALLAGCAPRQTVFQWHGDTFDLPQGAVHLARSRLCEQQAFRYGGNAYGLQFHLEVTAGMIEQWLAEPTNEEELADLEYIDPQRIRAGIAEGLPKMELLGERVLGRFAAMCRLRA